MAKGKLSRRDLMHLGRELGRALEPVMTCDPPARIVDLLARLAVQDDTSPAPSVRDAVRAL